MDVTLRRPDRKTLAFVTTVGACIALSAGLVVTAQARAKRPARLPDASEAPASIALERRILNESTVIRGTVVAVDPVSITPDLFADSDPLLTGTPHAVGTTIDAGQVIVEVSGRPVILLTGDLPAYRDLRVGSTGSDVVQLHSALSALGIATSDPADTYGMSTAQAIAGLYRSLGYDPPVPSPESAAARRSAERGVSDARRALEAARAEQRKLSEPATVLEAQVAITTAERAVTNASDEGNDAVKAALSGVARAQADLDATPGGSPDRRALETALQEATSTLAAAVRGRDGNVAAAQDQLALARAQAAARAAGDPLSVEQAEDAVVQAESDVLVAIANDAVPTLRSEILFAPTSTSTVAAIGASLGQRLTGTESVVTLSGGSLAVRADVAASVSRRLLGQQAVAFDEVGERSWNGTFDQVLAPTDSGSEGVAPGRVTVLLRTDDALPDDLLGRELRVTANQRGTTEEVLAVPLMAVASHADGSSSVTVEGSRRRISVELGVIADGWAEILDPPTSLRPGTKVSSNGRDGS